MEMIKGEPVGERDIAVWADEAEQGYDEAGLRRRARNLPGNAPSRLGPIGLEKFAPRNEPSDDA